MTERLFCAGGYCHTLKDYVAKVMTGLGGDRFAYLQMVRGGYR
ncbi:hypothetical protein [Agrobacterium sp. LAD9]|nr:hypothetical protein [Agrobacterium sp. LAD9]